MCATFIIVSDKNKFSTTITTTNENNRFASFADCSSAPVTNGTYPSFWPGRAINHTHTHTHRGKYVCLCACNLSNLLRDNKKNTHTYAHMHA